MSRLIWGRPGSRMFEAGVDRGVLYPFGRPGVPWNGLISVKEAPTGGKPTGYYYDGVKFANEASLEEYIATIEAYTYPPEFAELDGTVSSGGGLSYGQQPRKPFNFSYRSGLGNDLAGLDYGYRIHLVYNALAEPTANDHNTGEETAKPTNFSWAVTTTPVTIPGRNPTAHLIIDSVNTNPEILVKLEDILYGSSTSSPRMPAPRELITLFDDWSPLEIVRMQSSGLSPLIFLGKEDLKGDISAGIYTAPSTTRLVRSRTPGLFYLEY